MKIANGFVESRTKSNSAPNKGGVKVCRLITRKTLSADRA